MKVRSMIVEKLSEMNADGLFNPDVGGDPCGCGIDNLCPCGGYDIDRCVAGKRDENDLMWAMDTDSEKPKECFVEIGRCEHCGCAVDANGHGHHSVADCPTMKGEKPKDCPHCGNQLCENSKLYGMCRHCQKYIEGCPECGATLNPHDVVYGICPKCKERADHFPGAGKKGGEK